MDNRTIYHLGSVFWKFLQESMFSVFRKTQKGSLGEEWLLGKGNPSFFFKEGRNSSLKTIIVWTRITAIRERD